MVEGHRGSLICKECLEAAFRELVLNRAGEAVSPPATCVLCLSEPQGFCWRARPDGAIACKRCVNQSARVLAKDPDSGWKLPVAAG